MRSDFTRLRVQWHCAFRLPVWMPWSRLAWAKHQRCLYPLNASFRRIPGKHSLYNCNTFFLKSHKAFMRRLPISIPSFSFLWPRQRAVRTVFLPPSESKPLPQDTKSFRDSRLSIRIKHLCLQKSLPRSYYFAAILSHAFQQSRSQVHTNGTIHLLKKAFWIRFHKKLRLRRRGWALIFAALMLMVISRRHSE